MVRPNVGFPPGSVLKSCTVKSRSALQNANLTSTTNRCNLGPGIGKDAIGGIT